MLQYNATQAILKIELNLNVRKDGKAPRLLPAAHMNKSVPASMWSVVTSNRTDLYLHVLLVASESDVITATMVSQGVALYGNVKMIKYDKIPKSFRQRYLLSDFGWVNVSDLDASRINIPASSITSYWKPEVNLTSPFISLPTFFFPS